MYTIVEGFDKVGKTTFIQGGKGGKGTKLNKLSNNLVIHLWKVSTVLDILKVG